MKKFSKRFFLAETKSHFPYSSLKKCYSSINGITKIPALEAFLSFNDSEQDVKEKKEYHLKNSYQPYDMKAHLLSYLFQDCLVLALGIYNAVVGMLTSANFVVSFRLSTIC